MAMRIVLSLLLCVSVFGLHKDSFYRFYTKGEYKIKSEYEYAVHYVLHEVQCVFKCLIDTMCNSASFQQDSGRCVLAEQYAFASNTTLTRNHLSYNESWKSISLLLEKAEDTMCVGTDNLDGERCYSFDENPQNYSSKQEACSNHGGKLAEPSTRFEIEMIKNVMGQFNHNVNRTWWFGLSDVNETNQWVWLSSGQAPNYTDWTAGFPREQVQHMADCAAMFSGYGYSWIDAGCTFDGSGAICEL